MMKKSVIGLIILLIAGLSITAILTSISVLADEDSNEHDNKQNSKEKVKI